MNRQWKGRAVAETCRRWLTAATLLGAVLAVTGCAVGGAYSVKQDEEQYIISYVVPLRKNQPQKALALLQARFDEKCTVTPPLGRQAFQAMFKDTDRSDNYSACALLNAHIAQVLYETGQYQRVVPLLWQALRDEMYPQGWKYDRIGCYKLANFGQIYDTKFLEAKLQTTPLYEAMYTAMDRSNDANAKGFLHKNFLCQIDLSYDPKKTETIKTEFIAHARKHLGQQGVAEVEQYVKIIAGPARESEQRIQMRRYRDQVGTELQMRAQLATLYGNALAAVNRNGLNAPVGNDPSPFVEHWTGKAEEATGNVKLFAGS